MKACFFYEQHYSRSSQDFFVTQVTELVHSDGELEIHVYLKTSCRDDVQYSKPFNKNQLFASEASLCAFISRSGLILA